MSTPFDYDVSFQIRHPTIPAHDLAAGLPWKVTSSWTAGEPRMTPAGNGLSGLRTESYCSLRVASGDDGELTACLSKAVDTIGASDRRWDAFCQTGGRLNFYVFWYPNRDTGAVFSADLLKRMAALEIDLHLNVYEDRSGST